MPRILILTANSKVTPLRLATEVQTIRNALGEHSDFSITHESEVQGGDFVGLLIQQKPDILHFAGHGGRDDTITLRGGDDGEAPLTAEHLNTILRHIPEKPKLIVLNACHTSKFAEAIEPYVSVFVGSNGRIGDKAALHFSKVFYTNLACSLPISAAFELAKVSVHLAGHHSHLLELLPAKEVDPINVIFYGRPELMAGFSLADAGDPITLKGQTTKEKPNIQQYSAPQEQHPHYKLELWLRGVDRDIESVTYQVCHKDFQGENGFWEVSRATNAQFYTDLETYGDVTIRAVAWSKERGMGVECSLVTALERNYGKTPPKPIEKAINTLKAR
jgi:hypothetical protein